jgi:hypothetical protein
MVPYMESPRPPKREVPYEELPRPKKPRKKREKKSKPTVSIIYGPIELCFD